MKKVLSLLLVVLVGISSLFVSCNKKETNADNSLKDVQEKKVFILGLDDSYPPMGYRDERGEIVGFDIDTAREVCKRLGVELECKAIDWSAKELELLSGNIDCIWNGFTVTPEREKQILFSKPYLKNRQVLIVKNENKVSSIEELNGKKIGVQAGSSGEDAFMATSIYNTSKVVAYKDFLTAILDLSIGGVDAVVIDEIVADSQVKNASVASKITILKDIPLTSEDYAIGFRKNDKALRDAVDKEILQMKNDGTLAKISTKWFGSDLTNI